MFTKDVCVIGGAGHVGLPLALAFADTGLRTVVYDLDSQAVGWIRKGRMPFADEGADIVLQRVLDQGRLEACDTPEEVSRCRFVVLTVGTPLDEHLNPSFMAIRDAIDLCLPRLRDGQILILRSTVYPGTSEQTQRYLDRRGLNVKVAFCPERIAQGRALVELRALPQIVGAFDPAVAEEAGGLFGRLTDDVLFLTPQEAEFTKLMTNAWRYIQFAAVNQFYVAAAEHGLDFGRMLDACRFKYPRMAGMPGPGLTAGPCLLKDTMQLAAFSKNQFVLGHAAMLINEGLPNHLVGMARQHGDLSGTCVGILGMAFKAESDDARDSLSYKLRKLLLLETDRVLCTDPYVQDVSLLPLDVVVEEADVLFVGAPHRVYATLDIPETTLLIDIWNHVLPGRRQAAAG